MKGHPSPITNRELTKILSHLDAEDDFVFLETTRVCGDNFLSYLFLDQVGSINCKVGDDPVSFFDAAQRYLDQGFYLAGSFSYEFGYALEDCLNELADEDGQIVAEFGVYQEPYIYDHRQAGFAGGSPWPENLDRDFGEPDFRIENLSLSQSREDYLRNVESIKRYIESGDTYQVNYTLKILFDFEGSALSLYKALRSNQSVSYGAFIKRDGQKVLSFSPELFFRKNGEQCLVKPMKGTMRRAPGPDEDTAVRSRLANDLKNRSENVMIVDLLRNDLGRLCPMGEVEAVSLFDIETYETLHQMTSTVKGKLKPEAGLLELFRAIFPCGSVTGAPKIRTMEIIHELESGPRGVYTGGIGFISPRKDAVFNVPIRTVVLNDNKGEMGIGSGIVYDSDPIKEWDECLLKGRFLQASFPEFKLVETLLYHPRTGFWLLDRHLDRLAKSAAYWRFTFDRENILSALLRKGSPTSAGNCQRIRLLLGKDGAFDIESFECDDPFQEKKDKNEDIPLVVLSSQLTDADDPFYYHKTTFRDLYNKERSKSVKEGYYEVLFRNEKGEMTEGAITNLFVRKDGTLFTPPVRCGLLAGVFRGALISGDVAPPDGLDVREMPLTLADLKSADAIYLGNSVRGLIRVELLDGVLG